MEESVSDKSQKRESKRMDLERTRVKEEKFENGVMREREKRSERWER